MSKECSMKTKSSRFDRLVARYYPAVYSFASRLTDDPREAIALTRDSFNSVLRLFDFDCAYGTRFNEESGQTYSSG